MGSRIFVIAGRHDTLYNRWSGNTRGYEEMRSNIDFRRDRILAELNVGAINSRDDYYRALLRMKPINKREANAFQNWAILNYGNAREYFFEKHILPVLLKKVSESKLILSSGRTRRGLKIDAQSYVIQVKYQTRTGKIIEYLQRRDYRTGKILTGKYTFGGGVPR